MRESGTIRLEEPPINVPDWYSWTAWSRGRAGGVVAGSYREPAVHR